MAFDVKPYEPWMKEQVAKLFSIQYGVSENYFSTLMDNFYDHPYQKEKCIRVVALEGSTVIGFQSFFYWPYIFNEKTLNSYQSGNSLIHPEHRGKGIFQKLLSYFDSELQKKYKIDFLIGFPIEASKNSLIRNQWIDLLHLKWHIKIVNPFSFLYTINTDKITNTFSKEPCCIPESINTFRITKNKNFIEWRKNYSDNSKYFFFNYSEKENRICFSLKLSRRKIIINELIIGDIQTSTEDIFFISKGIETLIQKTSSLKFISLISIAINELSNFPITTILHQKKFLKISKDIYCMVKPYINIHEISDTKNWTLYRNDIDTW